MSAFEEGTDGRICIPSPPRAGQGITVMIDNYDSFTFNVVQFLVECGANLVIFRNDQVTLEAIEALDPVNLVISPGPGHPTTDAGISLACIERFQGRIPILGICMGLQCTVVANGGKVGSAGEIFHGKTSMIQHDGRGLFAGLGTEPIVGTRYHSLAADIIAMPSCLEATSWTETHVLMGVRHKEYTVEAVQYHPESVMSEHGHEMMKNFLQWRGGTWKENPSALAAPAAAATARASTSSETILQRIYRQRKLDVAAAKAVPGRGMAELERSLALQIDPPQVSFPERLLYNTSPSAPGVMAEMKRASPSKGDIAPEAHAGEQALAYARGGANVISVLTEPTWFKGTLEDLAWARRAVERLPHRPAILRKDFIVDEYQIAEARLAGADTVLLIVAMLDDATLRRLYDYSMQLGMDPLVEVNNAAEMQRALALNPKVVGVNNRNLHNFHVDMGTTTRLAQAALERGVILVALSGIAGRADVEQYLAQGVQAILVGEAFMRAANKSAFMAELQGRTPPSPTALRPVVKVCGLRTPEAVDVAIDAGADLLGMILAPGTKRTVSLDEAHAMVSRVHARSSAVSASCLAPTPPLGETWFTWHARRLQEAAQRRPLAVGVFRDQPLDEIVTMTTALQLDVVQLHGRTEPLDWTRYLPGVFVVRVFHVAPGTKPDEAQRALREATRPGYHHVILLDTAAPTGHGGSGIAFEWEHAQALATSDEPLPFLLAGGLTPANVAEAIATSHAWGVDTSSGVETDGQKDPAKIRAYVEAARATLA
ncbi:anthranilate synthase / indole-3-glycerol phosphate synthase [Malassezia pachydermatis]|uniref:Multifunctional tryptophan biosynthesis protein n=1 Tax=Malassezia pachydermatis TaxID=77020 RepID=A0A0N0RSQ7_9BASI|nr:anthranilate synthase component 2 [Malassezia pachydermatis]KOS16395.1 anthranilate synthase component 2 [Malassezia pachydermatis]